MPGPGKKGKKKKKQKPAGGAELFYTQLDEEIYASHAVTHAWMVPDTMHPVA